MADVFLSVTSWDLSDRYSDPITKEDFYAIRIFLLRLDHFDRAPRNDLCHVGAGTGAVDLQQIREGVDPLAHDSRGDQILNADSYRAQGYSMVVTDEELPETIVDAVQRLYSEREQYIHAMEQSSQGNAIATILEQIELVQKK